MGWDHSLICIDCKEEITPARNRKLYRDERNLMALDAFLMKHADHHLLFEADDNWNRAPDGTTYFVFEEPEGDKRKRAGCQLLQSRDWSLKE